MCYTPRFFVSLRRFRKFFVPREIDTLYYEVEVPYYKPQKLAKIPLEIRKQRIGKKTVYEGLINGESVHKSTLYTFVLLLIQCGLGKIPVIGDCITIPEYRGLRIYPHVLSYIIEDLQSRESITKVGILVGPDNYGSIRGIERAGFNYMTRIHGVRMGPLFLRTKQPD